VSSLNQDFEITKARTLTLAVPSRGCQSADKTKRSQNDQFAFVSTTNYSIIMMSYPSTIRKPMILATSSAEASEPPAKKRTFGFIYSIYCPDKRMNGTFSHFSHYFCCFLNPRSRLVHQEFLVGRCWWYLRRACGASIGTLRYPSSMSSR
jgi:hypothetical protein